VIELRVPGLRERPGDIRLLSEHFLKKASSGSNPVTISEDAYHLLEQHDFPGNIRELENTIERALTLCENNRIEAHDLQLRTVASVPAATENTSSAPPQTEETGLYPAVDLDQEISSLEDFLENIERQVIERALVACRWNKTAAAEKLGISFRALRYRLKKLDMQ
jgi:two-component system response regulator PilR (NtrC family)